MGQKRTSHFWVTTLKFQLQYTLLQQRKKSAATRVLFATFFFVIAIATATSPKKVIATATATTSQKSNRYYYRYFGEVTSLHFRYFFATLRTSSINGRPKLRLVQKNFVCQSLWLHRRSRRLAWFNYYKHRRFSIIARWPRGLRHPTFSCSEVHRFEPRFRQNSFLWIKFFE